MKAAKAETAPKDVQLRPFFGYFGGKWRDAPRNYPAPEFNAIVEPFAGSAGYSLRYPAKKVILCEVDPILAGVWKYLISVSAREIRAIPDIGPDETVDSLKGVSEAAKWLVGFWLNRGVASPRKKPSKWMRERVRPGSFWGERVRETIASQVDSIRHWKVYECDYQKCPTERTATWFIDPPYKVAGKYYRYGSALMNYDDLAEWCKERRGQVIVCENEGADWLPFEAIGHVKTTRANSRSNEVLWVRSSKSESLVKSNSGRVNGHSERSTNGHKRNGQNGHTIDVVTKRAASSSSKKHVATEYQVRL